MRSPLVVSLPPQNPLIYPAGPTAGALAVWQDAPPAYGQGPYNHSPLEPGPSMVPLDRPLKTNLLDETVIGGYRRFWQIPQKMAKGLRGDKDFNFSDLMLISKFPYYLGGAVFTAVAAMGGGSKQPFINAGVGVALYMLGQLGGDRLVNTLYKHKTGLNLARLYETPPRLAYGNKGDKPVGPDFSPMYMSTQFPRTDLTEPSEKQRLAKRLGLDHLPDPTRAVDERIHTLVGDSRLLKIIVGTVLSAVGAGYIARSEAWGQLGNVLSASQKAPGVIAKWTTFWEGLLSKTGTALADRLVPPVGKGLGRGIQYSLFAGLMLGGLGYSVYRIYKDPNDPKPAHNPSAPLNHPPAAGVASLSPYGQPFGPQQTASLVFPGQVPVTPSPQPEGRTWQ